MMCFVQSANALTLQVDSSVYPPTTVAGLANYGSPTPGSRSFVTDGSVGCAAGTIPAGGGSNNCRVVWNGTNWIETSSVPAACPAGSTLWTTGVSDHVGIKLNSCTNIDTPSEQCSVTAHTVVGATIAGLVGVTLTNYTPSGADVGKIAVVGMAYTGLGSGGSTVGAGGNSWAGQTMRGKIANVAGQLINLAVDPNAGIGNSAYIAANTVSLASVDIGTDNSAPLQTAINNLSAGGTLCVPPGNYQVDLGVQINKNVTIFCQPGATFYDPRNDGLPSGNDNRHFFIWYGGGTVTSGGINGCSYVGTNTGIYWKQFGTQPDDNRFAYTLSTSGNPISGITLQHNTMIDVWGDSGIALSTADDAGFTSGSTVSHNYFQNGWAYGPALIAGPNNTFDHNVMHDVCDDNEPNNTTEANQNHGETWSNNTCIATGLYYSNATYSTNEITGGAGPFCGGNATCNGGSTISGTGQITGHVAIQRGVGPYSGVNCSSNATGHDTCNQSPSSNCGTGC